MRNFGKGSQGGDLLEQQLLNVQALNLINLSLGNAIDTETPARLKKQIDSKAKEGDWFTASLAKRDKAGIFLPVVRSASYDFVSPKRSAQIPVGMLNSAALTPTYKAPGLPDLDEMKRQTVAAAIKRVDQAVSLQPLDRQRVKDAVVRSVRFGNLDPEDLNRIVGYAQGGSAKIARLAGAGAFGANVNHHSLDDLILELDGKFNSDKGYWQNRSAVKNALVGRLNAAGMSSDETYRLALRALGRTNELARMDALQGQERYNAAHRAELDATNPNRVGDDSQAVRWSKGSDGLTPLEHAQAVIRAKAAHGANPLWKGSAAANFDLLSLLPAGLKGLFASGLLASEGFSHPDDVARKEAGTITHSSGIDSWVRRLPGVRDIDLFTQVANGVPGLWPTEVKAPSSYNIDRWNTNSSGDKALKSLGDLYDFGNVAKDFYKGARGFLKIAEESNVRYAHEPENLLHGEPSPVRPGTTAKQLEEAGAAVNDLTATNQKGGFWQYVKGLGIKKILVSGKGVQLKGMSVRTPHDLAVASQMLRDPRFEVLRYIFVKDGKVVHHEAFSSRMPGASGSFVSQNGESLSDWINQRIRVHGADGYYLLHNHPSGNAAISEADMDMTKELPLRNFFRGHVIVNSNEYSRIDPDGKNFNRVPVSFHLTDPLLGKAAIPHEVLGRTIEGSEDLIKINRFLKNEPGLVTMIGVGKDSKIRTMAEIPETQVFGQTASTQNRGLGFTRRFAYQSGSTEVYAVVPSERLKNLSVSEMRRLRWAIENKVVTDVVDRHGQSLALTFGIINIPHAPSLLGPKFWTKNWH